MTVSISPIDQQFLLMTHFVCQYQWMHHFWVPIYVCFIWKSQFDYSGYLLKKGIFNVQRIWFSFQSISSRRYRFLCVTHTKISTKFVLSLKLKWNISWLPKRLNQTSSSVQYHIWRQSRYRIGCSHKYPL